MKNKKYDRILKNKQSHAYIKLQFGHLFINNYLFKELEDRLIASSNRRRIARKIFLGEPDEK